LYIVYIVKNGETSGYTQSGTCVVKENLKPHSQFVLNLVICISKLQQGK